MSVDIEDSSGGKYWKKGSMIVVTPQSVPGNLMQVIEEAELFLLPDPDFIGLVRTSVGRLQYFQSHGCHT